MITSDQPTCFPENVLAAVSSKKDGTVLDRTIGIHHESIVANRIKFCEKNGIDYQDTAYQRIVYSAHRTYALISEVDDGSTTKNTLEVVADALITSSPGVAMLLPVADCTATVVYDYQRRVPALLHLGRHSSVARLMDKVLKRLLNDGSQPENLIVWMSPSIQSPSYVMEYFELADSPGWVDYCVKQEDGYHLDIPGFNAQVCRDNGVKSENIYISPIDTATSDAYFSHFSGDTTGRFAVVAMLK